MTPRVIAHLEDMRSRRIPRGVAAPLLWRGLWAIGVPIAPPLFWAPVKLAGFLSLVFMSTSLPPLYALLAPLEVGWHWAVIGFYAASFGPIWAGILNTFQRKLRLPKWRDYRR